MGLIAREIEARGIPTLCLSSALSITRAVNPPRAAYLDFPLGHTAGKAHEPTINSAIMRDALEAFEKIRTPGEIVRLAHEWCDDDAWKDESTHPTDSKDVPKDERAERFDTPQYQSPEDRIAAERRSHRPDCVFID
ncbi:MAG: hypothetical protein JRF61_11220 [Deltaproteobacteria bacterium]|nr:hypothetical protein [Deltaproteobacteria bacterium]